MTTTVRQILDGKGDAVFAVAPSATVLEALRCMQANDIGGVLVTEGTQLRGIFTERDYARKVTLQGKASKDVKVSEVMTANVLTISPSQTIDDVMAMMTENRIRHIPVVEKGTIVGVITIGDAVKAVIAEQQATIEHLESYISGDLGA
ncbi:MAG: CBS domain-containing protein [Zoogloeaceae bacterium]|nr:CBS domain-containing protein [Rhodocyclaceae bacterium]MCP5237490.1 CBS domain-containing protein [Zoogloeaceae bacterium]